MSYDNLKWSDIPVPKRNEWYAVFYPWGRTEWHRWDGKQIHRRATEPISHLLPRLWRLWRAGMLFGCPDCKRRAKP